MKIHTTPLNLPQFAIENIITSSLLKIQIKSIKAVGSWKDLAVAILNVKIGHDKSNRKSKQSDHKKVKKMILEEQKVSQSSTNRNGGENTDQGKLINLEFKQNQKTIEVNQTIMFQSQGNEILELQFLEEKIGLEAFIKFPLEKLCESPRVRHILEVTMISKKSMQSNKIVKVMEVEMDVTYITRPIGKFTIHALEAELTRNTDLNGDMDPYVVLVLDESRQVTEVHQNQGKHSLWTNKLEFEVLTGNPLLNVKIYDKDVTFDDLVCESQLQLLKEGLLKPAKDNKTSNFILNMNFQEKEAGVVRMEYTFELLPFKF